MRKRRDAESSVGASASEGSVSPELIDLDAGAGRTDVRGDVSTSGSGRWLLAVAVAVVALGFVALRSQPEDLAGGADDEESTRSPSTTNLPTTTDPPSDTAASDTADPDEGSTTLPTIRATELARLGQIFDAPTGYSIVVGGEQPTRRVNLDSGQVSELNARGSPVAMFEGHLVYSSSSSNLFASLDLGDPDAAVVTLGEIGDFFIPIFGLGPGELWMMRWGALSGPARRYDITTGDVVEELDLSSIGLSANFQPFRTIGVWASLVNGRTGGVFRRVDGEFVYLGSGRVISVGIDLALVEDCDRQLQCSRRWVDVETFEDVDLPQPSDIDEFVRLVGGDEWLVRSGPPDWQTEIIEVATGESLPLDVGGADGGSIDVSPDGRFLAYATQAGVEVIDLARGHSGLITNADLGFNRSGWLVPLFVPNTEFAES